MRDRIAPLSADDPALLVKVVAEAINNISSCKEIADNLGMSNEDLNRWGDETLYTGDSDNALVTLSETALGWYHKQY